MVYADTIFGETMRGDSAVCSLTPASMAADECPAGHWHSLPLCVKTSGITYVLLPDASSAPAFSKREVLSWYYLPNLVQRTEATWPAEPGSVPVQRTVSL